MEVVSKKIVAGLAVDEVEKVKEAGGIIGSFNRAFEAGEITEISDETKQLLQAIIDVATKVVSR